MFKAFVTSVKAPLFSAALPEVTIRHLFPKEESIFALSITQFLPLITFELTYKLGYITIPLLYIMPLSLP
jgi:hypothetical protein